MILFAEVTATPATKAAPKAEPAPAATAAATAAPKKEEPQAAAPANTDDDLDSFLNDLNI